MFESPSTRLLTLRMLETASASDISDAHGVCVQLHKIVGLLHGGQSVSSGSMLNFASGRLRAGLSTMTCNDAQNIFQPPFITSDLSFILQSEVATLIGARVHVNVSNSKQRTLESPCRQFVTAVL